MKLWARFKRRWLEKWSLDLPAPLKEGELRLAKSDKGTFTVQHVFFGDWRFCGTEYATEAEARARMERWLKNLEEERRLDSLKWTPLEEHRTNPNE